MTAVHIALRPKDRSAFLARCRLFGYSVAERDEASTCEGPGVRFLLAPGDGGIVGFEMMLRDAVDPPVEHRLGRSVLRLGPGRVATWSFPPTASR